MLEMMLLVCTNILEASYTSHPHHHPLVPEQDHHPKVAGQESCMKIKQDFYKEGSKQNCT